MVKKYEQMYTFLAGEITRPQLIKKYCMDKKYK